MQGGRSRHNRERNRHVSRMEAGTPIPGIERRIAEMLLETKQGVPFSRRGLLVGSQCPERNVQKPADENENRGGEKVLLQQLKKFSTNEMEKITG